VLTRFFSSNLDEGIGLGKLSKTFNELGEISSRLYLDGNTYDWRDGVLHNTNAVSVFNSSDGTLLNEVLIDTDESDSVTTWNIRDSFDLSSHHNDSSLDILDVEVSFLSMNIIGAQNSDFLSGGNGTSENTTEGIESTLIVSRDHLRDEDHKTRFFVTCSDSFACIIISRSLIKVSSSVLLGLLWGGQLQDNLFKKSLSSVDPFLEDALEEGLRSEFLLVSFELEFELIAHFPDGIKVFVENVSAH